MGTRWRKVRSDLLFNKSLSALAIVSLAVGTLAVGAMYLAATSVSSSFDASFLGANPPSAMLVTDPFSLDLVDEVVAHPAVAEAEGRRLLQARASAVGGNPVNVELVAMADFAANHVAHIQPTDGAWPPAAGTVVLERTSLRELGVAVGDVVSVTVPGRDAVELTVTGSAFDVYEVTPMFGGAVRGYVALDTMVGLTGSDSLNALYLRAASQPLDREQAIATTAAVRDEVLAPAGVAIQLSAIQDPGEHRAANAVSFTVTAMALLSLLALVIAVALVVNTVTALLARQRRHIGVMRAIGASSGQLTTQYLGYVLLLGAGAVALAVPLSLVAGRFLAGFVADLANFDLVAMGVPYRTIGLELAIAALLPLVAVVFAVRRASRITVQAAITDRGIAGNGARARVRLPFGRPTLLAFRNAVRNRPRLALTVLTIALCGGVLGGVMSTGRALGNLTDQVAGYWAYDVELALTEPVVLSDAAAVLSADPEVAGVEGWFQGQAFRIRPDGTENENISLVAAPAGSALIEPTLTGGRWYAPGDDHPIVINSHLADEEADLSIGDAVVLDIGGSRREWTVVGIATTTLVGPVAYVPVDDLAGEVGESGKSNFLAVGLVPGADQGAAAGRLEAMARAAGIPVGVVQTNAERTSFVTSLFTLVVGLLLFIGAILALVAVVGVAGTMTLGVIEQTREVGVVRTLGASSRAVRRLLSRQGVAIALVGCLFGVVLSIPVDLVLRNAIGSGLLASPLAGSFSWFGIGIWAIVALLIGALGSTRPARVAARMTIRDTLAYE